MSLTIKPFRSFNVSTKTFIVYTNLTIDIEKIFEDGVIPITDYKVIQKKRGRKKKQPDEDPNKTIPSGSVILVQYKDQYRGVKFKKSTSFFRNSMSIVMKVEDKLISFKVSQKGKFQITGCKTNEQAEICILSFWDKIKYNPFVYKIDGSPYIKAYFEPVMYNIDFSTGFQINREALDIFINTKTPYTSLLETTIGYTGVNIKFPVTENKIRKIKIDYCEYKPEGKILTQIPYDVFNEKLKTKSKKKKHYNTFLVFQSGSVIMSGKTICCMEDTYYEFFEIVKRCFPEHF